MTDNYKLKKILITGGSGMVGRNFFEHHKSKIYSILRPSRTEMNLLNFQEVDNYLLKNKPDIIIHAAARVGGIQANIKNPILFLCENADMGKNLLLAAKKQNINTPGCYNLNELFKKAIDKGYGDLYFPVIKKIL